MLPRFVRAVGWASVGVGAAAAAAPRQVASLGGARDVRPDLVPVLVRLAGARQVAIGLAVLTRRPTDVRRTADLFLPLTVLDAGAVLHGVGSGALHRRAGVLALGVLATDVAVGLRARV